MISARIDHLVGVQDEVAHVGVVDRGLGAGLPRLLGLLVVRIGADELDLRGVAEHRRVQVTQLPADHDVQQLRGFDFGVGHGESGKQGRACEPAQ